MSTEHATDEELAEVLRGSAEGAIECLAGEFAGIRDPEGDGDFWPQYLELAKPIVERERKMAAELRAVRAPVDVEAATLTASEHAHEAITGETTWYPEERVKWCAALRPHVERAAKMQREAEGLRAELAKARSLMAHIDFIYDGPRPHETERARADLATARAEIERLKGLGTEAESERSKWMMEAQRYKACANAIYDDLPESERVSISPNRKAEELPAAVRSRIDRLTKIADAWKALAKAEAAWGTGEGSPGRTAAAHACCAAKADLRALGIDPEAP